MLGPLIQPYLGLEPPGAGSHFGLTGPVYSIFAEHDLIERKKMNIEH